MIVPDPAPEAVTVRANCAVNVALIEIGEVPTVKPHAPVPLQAPPQPVNVEPPPADWARAMLVP